MAMMSIRHSLWNVRGAAGVIYSVATSSIPVETPSYKSPPKGQPTKSSFPPSHRVCVCSSFALTHMQVPKKEIANIIRTLCTTRDANELEGAVKKYFVEDAKFSHPLCRANSRNEILGLFQWYRFASPETKLDVVSVSECSTSESRWTDPLTSIMHSVRLRLERSRCRSQRKAQRLVYSSSKQRRQVSFRFSSALSR